MYGKCSKILTTFFFLFSTKILVIMAGIHKMLVCVSLLADVLRTEISYTGLYALQCIITV